MQRVKDLGTLVPKRDVSNKSQPSWKRKQKNSKSKRRRGTLKKQGPVNQLSKAHMKWQKPRHKHTICTALHQVSVFLLLLPRQYFMRFLSMWISGSLILVSFLEIFSFSLFLLSKLNMMIFFCFILQHFILLLSLPSPFFLLRDRKGMDLEERNWEK